jgi:KDO2-lipid IV(A) lauroyltransferase
MHMPSRTKRSIPRDVLNSRQGLELARGLSRIVPPSIGHRLAYRIADLVASRREWQRVKAVRCNQWIVRGEKSTREDLDLAVRETFRNIAHSIYDVHHYISNSKAIDRLIDFSPAIQSIIDQSQLKQEGQIAVSLHLGNHDLAYKALTLHGLRGLLLNLAELESGYEVQYKIRKKISGDVLPIGTSAIRHAVTRLREGGTVITVADWPAPESKYSPSFFGRPSAAPIHYVYLASKARVPIKLLVLLRQSNGHYYFLVSEPILVQDDADKHLRFINNAEAVLKVAEDFIRQAPQQWAMSHPLWPQLMDQVP